MLQIVDAVEQLLDPLTDGLQVIGPLAILAVVIASPAGLNGLHERLHHALTRRRHAVPAATVSGGN